MALDTPTLLAQIDDALARCGASVEKPYPPTHPPTPGVFGTSIKGNGALMATTLHALIDRIAPNSSYQQSARELSQGAKGATHATVRDLVGVVVALRADVEAGYLRSLTEVVHADLFADFLSMAAELQRGGYKDAAAVIAGSTLEEHLRKLVTKAQLPTANDKGEPLGASRLNDDLKSAAVYNPLQHRAVQSWIDIRNAAAHAHYEEYDHEQVAGMIDAVGDFMSRYPA